LEKDRWSGGDNRGGVPDEQSEVISREGQQKDEEGNMRDDIVEVSPIVIAKKQPGFVETPYVRNAISRALNYIRAGYPVHFAGPASTGKTSLALYTAAQLDRPVMLVHGDEQFNTSGLVGGEQGYRRRKLTDNSIHSVMKTDESFSIEWMKNRLTVACKHGFTLLYDEFTRSRPEANNALLSVLEEKVLDLPAARGEQGYLSVHPDFSAIFTSNPEEYAGVYAAQDALKDRMITIKLGHYDRETEIAITCAKSGISRPQAEKIVDIVRGVRKDGKTPTVRSCIMLAKALKQGDGELSAKDGSFVEACLDILTSEVGEIDEVSVTSLIQKHYSSKEKSTGN
jgi:nitric oxide reductase NorQ protein